MSILTDPIGWLFRGADRGVCSMCEQPIEGKQYRMLHAHVTSTTPKEGGITLNGEMTGVSVMCRKCAIETYGEGTFKKVWEDE